MMKRSPVGVVAGSVARSAGAIALLACAGLAAPASAANILWDGGISGEYLNPLNWAGDEVPGFSDTLVLNTTPSMEIIFTQDIETGRLLHPDGDLTLELNGHTLDLRVASPITESWTSGVTTDTGGDVHINGGRVLCNYAGIADSTGQTSTLFLDDPAAVFESRQSTRVGAFADGTIALSNQASLIVGNDLVIGETAFGDGVVTLLDAGTTAVVGDQIQVGALGDGILRVNPNTSVACQELFVAAFEFSLGEVTINGPEAFIDVVGGAGVGFEGQAEIDINSGGSFTAQQLRIGFAPFSDGIIRVQGPGSLLHISTDALIGSNGSGELLVRNGGRADLGELSMTSAVEMAVTRVQGVGSRLDIRDELRVGSIGAGLLEISTGAAVTADDVEVNPGGLVTIDETSTFEFTNMVIAGQGVGENSARGAAPTGLLGNGFLTGNVTNRGIIEPTPNYSAISIDGSLVLDETSDLMLDFRMPGIGGEQSDALVVSGDVVLGGTLHMSRGSSSVSPFLLQSVPIITGAASISGRFDDAVIDHPASGSFRLVIVHNGTDVELVATVIGDLDADGIVNSSDLASLLSGWESSEPNADFNDDGVVDATDLATLLAQWTK